MSRKDYKAAAEVIARELEQALEAPQGDGDVAHFANRAVVHTLERVARELADMFKRDNSAFDYGRFFTACGLNSAGKVA